MSEVRVEEELDVTAERIWEIVRDFGGLMKWNEGIESCEVEGSGVGSVRTIKIGSLEIQERLEHIDDVGRSFSYSIVSGPVPVENYLASMTIHEEGEKSRITWQSSFDPKGASEEDCANLFTGIYRGGIASLRKALG